MNSLASYIDHTILKPFATVQEVHQFAKEAISNQFAALCTSPFHAPMAQGFLFDSDVKNCTVIGFPHGHTGFPQKLEMIYQLAEYVDEFDVVVNFQALQAKHFDYVEHEIMEITSEIHKLKKTVKWIIESSNLTEEQLYFLCNICNEAKVDFVKTSTGFIGDGARVEDVKKMRSLLNNEIKIKASGGIRSASFARELITAGADRIGCSSSVKIINEI